MRHLRGCALLLIFQLFPAFAAPTPDCGNKALLTAFEETEQGTSDILKTLPAGKETATLTAQAKTARATYDQLGKEAAALRDQLKNNKALTPAQRIQMGASATAKETEQRAMRMRLETLQEQGRFHSVRDTLSSVNGPARQVWDMRSRGLAFARKELDQAPGTTAKGIASIKDENAAMNQAGDFFANAHRTGAKIEREMDEIVKELAARKMGRGSNPKTVESNVYDELAKRMDRRSRAFNVNAESSEWEIYRAYKDAEMALQLARASQSLGDFSGTISAYVKRVEDLKQIAEAARKPIEKLEQAVKNAGSNRTAPSEFQGMDPVFKPF